VGPYVVGYIREASGSGYGAMLFLAALMALVGLLTLAVRHEITAEGTRVEEGRGF
jgi:cyanate permease